MTDNCVKIEEFAKELLEYIFNQLSIDYRDLISLSICCKRFHEICLSDDLWKNKLFMRWSCKVPVKSSYKSLYKELHIVDRKLKLKILAIEKKCYFLNTVPEDIIEEELEEFLTRKQNKIDIVLTALELLKNSFELNIKFHAEKLYCYVFYKKLKKKWSNVIANSMLLKGVVLISKWCNLKYSLSTKAVEQQIDDIVKLIEATVPRHVWNISENSSFNQVMEVIKSINFIVYGKLLFQGNADFYYDIHNSFIDQVLERRVGIPISLGVLYMAIAKKLGLLLQGVNFPGHFLLTGTAKNDGKAVKFYLDAFNNGEVLTESQCLERFLPDVSQSNAQKEVLFQQAHTKEILVRMVANIVNIHRQWASLDSNSLGVLQSSLELMLILSPNDDESRLLLSRIYLHYGINLKLVVENLQSLFASSRRFDSNVLDQLLLNANEKQNQVFIHRDAKKRSSSENEGVAYRVGMIMKHLRYNYLCVIYGWNNECNMTEEWKIQMGIYNLLLKDKQPFYNVLVDDGSTRYAAQENLTQVSISQAIKHKEIGKHFKKFNGNYYEATEMLAEMYPEDQIEPHDFFATKISAVMPNLTKEDF